MSKSILGTHTLTNTLTSRRLKVDMFLDSEEQEYLVILTNDVSQAAKDLPELKCASMFLEILFFISFFPSYI